MQLYNILAMINSTNGYKNLKYPLLIFSFLSIILSVILLFSFRSGSWFTYELFTIQNRTSGTDRLTFELGSLGLWSICIRHSDQAVEKCDQWIRQTRPENFQVILIFVSCAFFLSNLIICPSWITVILLFYNQTNRFIHYIIGLSWVLFLLSLTLTSLLICALIFASTTKLYAPGVFVLDDRYMVFHAGPGLHYEVYGTSLIDF